jgi:hypothetical protein
MVVVTSLNKSLADIQTLLTEERKANKTLVQEMEQRINGINKTYKSLSDWQKKEPWLLLRCEEPPIGRCHLCTRHATQLTKIKNWSKTKKAWVQDGCELDPTRIAERILTHKATAIHAMAAQLEAARRQNQIGKAFSAASALQKIVTVRFLQHVFNNVLLHHSYRDFPKEQYFLFLQGFDIGNRHQTAKAAALAVDAIYAAMVERFSEYIKSTNPSTGRRRHFHISLDKMTFYQLQRQIINIRFLDSNGKVILCNLTSGIIKEFADFLPEYTATLGDDEKNTNYTNGTGVTQHARFSLTNILGLTDSEIGIAAQSFSSDREGVYSGKHRGMQKLWRVFFKNEAFMYNADRCHKLESMMGAIMAEPDMRWMGEMFENIASFVDRFFSPKKRIAARKMASISGDAKWKTLTKSVVTRFIFWSVLAIDRTVHDFSILCDLWTQEANENDVEALGLLRRLVDPDFIPTLLMTADVLDKCVNFSKAGQNDVSSVWRDQYQFEKLKTEIARIKNARNPAAAANSLLFPRLHKHLEELKSKGTFKGHELLKVGPALRAGSTGHSVDSVLTSVTKGIDRGKLLANKIMHCMDDALDLSGSELLMKNALDFRNINVNGRVDQVLDEPFLIFAKKLSTGTLKIPKHPEGEPDAYLLEQFHTFKKRFMDNFERCTSPGFRPRWHKKNDKGQQYLAHQSILETFLDPANNLHEGIPDVMEMLEIAAVSSRTQSDTERTVKLVKMVMKDRYQGTHDEQTQGNDRANEEVFISQNGDPNVKYFPGDMVYAKWSANHLPAQMTTMERESTTMTKMNERPKRQLFW